MDELVEAIFSIGEIGRKKSVGGIAAEYAEEFPVGIPVAPHCFEESCEKAVNPVMALPLQIAGHVGRQDDKIAYGVAEPGRQKGAAVIPHIRIELPQSLEIFIQDIDPEKVLRSML